MFQLKISISHLPHLLRLCPWPCGSGSGEVAFAFTPPALLCEPSWDFSSVRVRKRVRTGAPTSLSPLARLPLRILTDSGYFHWPLLPFARLEQGTVLPSPKRDVPLHRPWTCVSDPSLPFQPTTTLCSWHSFPRLLPSGPPTPRRGEKKTQWQLRPPMQRIRPSPLCQWLVWGGQRVGLARPVSHT